MNGRIPGMTPGHALRPALCAVALAIVAIFGAPLLFAANQGDTATSVTAKKGPVQLRLEVFRTKIRLGDPILVRLTLKNIGRNGFVVTDGLFSPHADFVGVMSMVKAHGFGIYVTLHDPSGREIYWDQPFSDGVCTEPGKESSPWSRAIISTASAKSASPDEFFSKLLKPGESIRTGPWIQRGACPRAMTEEERSLGFAQLHAPLNKTGLYYIQAVYDSTPRKSMGSSFHKFPDDVKVDTSRIPIEVEAQ